MTPVRPDRKISLSRLLAGWVVVEPAQDAVISGLQLDSRELVPGDLFIALDGGHHHGLDFIEQAVAAGAAAVVCEAGGAWNVERIDAFEYALPLLRIEGLRARVSELAGRFFDHPSRDLYLAGITGTNGKTSCASFLAQALMPDLSCAMIGTIGNGLPGALQPASHTTPDPVGLQRLLAGYRDQGIGAVAMEVSSHALDQGRAEDLAFDIALFTNLTRDHLDYHGDMASYGASKARLFSRPGLQAAIINMDDPFGRELACSLPESCRLIGYASRSEHLEGLSHWIHFDQPASSAEGLRAGIDSSWGCGILSTRLLGTFNLGNLCAVLGVLLDRGLALDEALARLGGLQTVPGRMECFRAPEAPLVVVDYAHTPDALEQALRALRPHCAGRLVCVFGCGGDRDRGKRPQMGEVAGRLADQLVLTDDNPRSEPGELIVREILAGVGNAEAARVEHDRAMAIRLAVAGCGEGDIVLVAGKGHETTQVVADRVLPYSDRETVAALLAGGPA